MAPSSILLVNRITEKIPAEITELGRANYRHKKHWEVSFQQRLAAAQDKAFRPNNGRLNSQASAVLFVDKSELLACWCRSVSEGANLGQWWWRSYFGREFNRHPVELTVQQMLEAPQIVPSVFNQLINWRRGAEFIRLLDEVSIAEVTSAMLCQFELTGLDEALQGNSGAAFELENYSNETSGRVGTNADKQRKLGMRQQYDPSLNEVKRIRKSPWNTLLGGYVDKQTLSREEATLLGIASVLHKSPLALKKAKLQHEIVTWWHEKAPQETSIDKPCASSIEKDIEDHNAFIEQSRKRADDSINVDKSDESSQIHFERSSEHDQYEVFSDEDALITSQQEDSLTLHTSERIDENSKEDNPKWRDRKDENLKGENTPKFEHARETIDPTESDDLTEMSSLESPASPIVDQDSEIVDVAENDDSIKSSVDDWNLTSSSLEYEALLADERHATDLGGVLYLINLLTQIDLHSCVADHDNSEQLMSSWTLLDATARSLLGTSYASLNGDSIWKILAALDERKQDATLGNDFQIARQYSMPKKWFEFFNADSEATYYWAIENKRLRVWFDEGVLLERDLVNSNELEKQVTEELNQFFPVKPSTKIVESHFSKAPLDNSRHLEQLGIAHELAGFLSFVLPVLRSYLRLVLELKSAAPESVLKHLITCDAQIFIGACHIDMVANINNTSFAIRCSGLDQDPGWLLQYGRVVLFHFSNQ